MTALLFGSISTVADTSELQRAAFNEAFASHGLAWNWEQDEYRTLLTKNGGAARIADYAAERGEQVDAAAVHATKSELFQGKLAAGGIAARPGVLDSIREARNSGLKVGLVTTTTPENVTALLQGLEVPADSFDVIVDLTKVEESKPDAAAYEFALQTLGESAASCLAIEDNLGGVQSAQAAHVRVVAFPNENTAAHDFGETERVDAVSLALLEQLGA